MALNVYKKGQGTAARGVAGVVAALLGVWASRQMYHYGAAGLGKPVQIAFTAVAALLFAGVPLYLILFHRQVVDLLIETQQEMRKVAWSTRSEVTGSTIVVIVTVALLSVFIFVTDLVVNALMQLVSLY